MFKRSIAAIIIGVLLTNTCCIGVSAQSEVGTKTKTLIFEPSSSRTMTATVNLPGIYEIESISVDTGNVTGVVVDGGVKVTVSDGAYVYRDWDDYLYSKQVSSYKESGSDSFNNSISYSEGGYSGILYKDGSSRVVSGDYTPSDTKYVTNQTSSYYNSGGYSGSLDGDVVSGSYTPAHSRHESGYGGSYTWGHAENYNTVTYVSQASRKPNTASKYYNSGGYSGYLYYREWPGTHPNSPKYISPTFPDKAWAGTYIYRYLNNYEWSGTVTKPASDTRVYRYSGFVTKPSVDTRVYRQDYSGTIYKGGYTNHKYGYTVTIKYKTYGIIEAQLERNLGGQINASGDTANAPSLKFLKGEFGNIRVITYNADRVEIEPDSDIFEGEDNLVFEPDPSEYQEYTHKFSVPLYKEIGETIKLKVTAYKETSEGLELERTLYMEIEIGEEQDTENKISILEKLRTLLR